MAETGKVSKLHECTSYHLTGWEDRSDRFEDQCGNKGNLYRRCIWSYSTLRLPGVDSPQVDNHITFRFISRNSLSAMIELIRVPGVVEHSPDWIRRFDWPSKLRPDIVSLYGEMKPSTWRYICAIKLLIYLNSSLIYQVNLFVSMLIHITNRLSCLCIWILVKHWKERVRFIGMTSKYTNDITPQIWLHIELFGWE